jgi:hypothetical protein
MIAKIKKPRHDCQNQKAGILILAIMSKYFDFGNHV